MFFYIEPQVHQMTDIYFMESSISLEDNIWDLIKSDEQSQSLAQLHSENQVMKFNDPEKPLADTILVSLFLRAANIKNAYKREAYGVLDYLGDLGGIFSIISLLAYYFTSNIVKRLYYAAIIASTYRIQHYDRNFSPYYQSRLLKNKLTSESDSMEDMM